MYLKHQPKIIQIHFDGIEVMRIEDGKKCQEVLVPTDMEPEVIEMRWDGEVVYAISASYSGGLQLQLNVLVNSLF